jgi:hypothetical protein
MVSGFLFPEIGRFYADISDNVIKTEFILSPEDST